MQPERETEMMTIKQVATLLNVSIGTVYNLAHSGELRSFRIREALRIARDDVDTYLAAHVSPISHIPNNGVST